MLQKEILHQAHISNPTARWCIKADWTDIITGIQESVKGDWSGDIDLNDGNAQAHKQRVTERIQLVKNIDQTDGSSLHCMKQVYNDLSDDDNFLSCGKSIVSYYSAI